MSATWHYSDAPEENAAESLAQYLKENQDRPILLLTSGGSWLSVLSKVAMPTVDNVTLTVLDERFTNGAQINNFSLLSETGFFHNALSKGVQLIDMRVRANESHHAHADRMQSELWSWKQMYPEGLVLALMGIGEDGHTAGIIAVGMHEQSFTGLFDATDRLVVAYKASKEYGNPCAERTTVTFRFLRDCVDAALVYAAGSKKCPLLIRLKKEQSTLYEMPAAIVFAMKKVDIFTDCS